MATARVRRKREEGDRISSLSDDVICHILSFLPTKYSVRTRLLSTRWKYLFAHVPVLDLDNSTGTSNSRKSFVNSVNNLFAVYNVTEMTRFRLSSFTEAVGIDDFVSWISSVICRKVREVDISMFVRERVFLPHELFSSQTLSVLKLYGGFVIEQVPSCASLPCLKTLHLHNVYFYHSTRRVLSICPVLEDLCLDDCTFGYAEVLDISHPLLRKLRITHYHNKELLLNVPSLVDFEYIFNTTSAIAISGEIELKSLDKARLQLYYNDVDVVAKLFALVSHARHLSLNQTLIKALQGCNPTLPTFHKLTILEVDEVSKLVPGVLNRCSLLEVLIFTKGSSSEVGDTRMKCYENVPSCVTMCLKEIKFREFTMQKIEYRLVRYFLKNAQVLEKLNIRSSLCLEGRNLLSRKLSTLDKFSQGCKIEIETDGETEG